jgi:hypothetical protein
LKNRSNEIRSNEIRIRQEPSVIVFLFQENWFVVLRTFFIKKGCFYCEKSSWQEVAVLQPFLF